MSIKGIFGHTASLVLGLQEIAPGLPLNFLVGSSVHAAQRLVVSASLLVRRGLHLLLCHPVETALHFTMGNISELTWDKLIDAEVAKPTPETRDRALRFFAEAGFEHPQQCMGLKTGELIQGQNGVDWPDGHVDKALVKRMFDQVQALYSASRHRK